MVHDLEEKDKKGISLYAPLFSSYQIILLVYCQPESKTFINCATEGRNGNQGRFLVKNKLKK